LKVEFKAKSRNKYPKMLQKLKSKYGLLKAEGVEEKKMKEMIEKLLFDALKYSAKDRPSMQKISNELAELNKAKPTLTPAFKG
jgi:hypothetical protein